MSRTKRKIYHRYKQEREDIINNEMIYPFDLFVTYSRGRKKENNNDKRTNWDMFFSARFYHGYDGSYTSGIGEPTSRLPTGYWGGWRYGSRAKRFWKQKASHARRLYQKRELRRIFEEWGM